MLLGLDLGTTSVKAVLARTDGCIVARASTPLRLLHVADEGVEQDIEEIWSATISSIKRVASASDRSAVRAIGVSSQGGALQICDGGGLPVGRVISWLDGRGGVYDERLTRQLGRRWFARHVGHGSSAVAAGQLLRLKEQCPELLRRPNRICFVGDLIVGRLCGRGAHDATSLSIATLLNPWLGRADPDLLGRLGVSEDQLPDLISPQVEAGRLLEQVAGATSLPAGIPVSGAIHDQYAAALGAGAVHGGDVMFGAGTAWVLLATVEHLSEPVIPEAFVCTHLAEGLYGQLLSLGNGGSSLAWAVRLLGLEGTGPRELDELLGRVVAGSDGLRFWPLLGPKGGAGLRPETRGRLMGLKLSHRAEHILRAVVEGLALELARYLRFLVDNEIAVRRLAMCGGAAASRITPQIVADATALPVVCPNENQTGALGAAIVARGLIDRSARLAELTERMVRPGALYQPGASTVTYREMFEEYIASLPVADEDEAGP